MLLTIRKDHRSFLDMRGVKRTAEVSRYWSARAASATSGRRGKCCRERSHFRLEKGGRADTHPCFSSVDVSGLER
jgi:hypothetical protein